MALTQKQKNRAIRQDELRAKLAAGSHLIHAIKGIDRIKALEPGDNAEFLLKKEKTFVDLQLKLVAKYLPDLKSIELTGEGGDDLKITVIERKIVDKTTN